MPMRVTSEPKATATATATTTKLSKYFSQIAVRHMYATAHARGLIHPILVLAHVVPLTPFRVGEDSVGFHHEFELFFVTTLGGSG